jgi:hypothetical protein
MSFAPVLPVRSFLATLVLLPCVVPVVAGAPQQPAPRNLHIARTAPFPFGVTYGPGRSFLVPESGQGGIDLNGDGDSLDRVLHVLPQTSGPLLNVGLAGDEFGPILVGDTLALGVPEKDQGGADLNGDGDALDVVLHLVDASSGAVSNTGLALFGGTLRLSGSFAALSVYENAQGIQDLNGDGDALDRVLHLVELSSGAVTNFGLAVSQIELGDQVVAAHVPEYAQEQDLNGDGDLSDTILHVIDAVSGSVHNQGVDGSGATSISAGYVAYSQSETVTGTDLNGDGDVEDFVVQLFAAASGGKISTGLASLAPSRFEGPYLVVVVSEIHQGADLNQDGDEDDGVPFIRHVPTGAVSNTALAVAQVSGLHGRQLTLHVSEFLQGKQDLNGDGDWGDTVLHVVELATGAVTNVGMQVYLSNPSSRMIGFLVQEALQGGQDLNGDGDKSDRVWHAYDPWTGVLTNLGVSAIDQTALSIAQDDFLVCVATESVSGQQDLNGDGDLFDDVVFLLRAGAAPQNLGVALTTSSISKSMSNSGRRVILPVFEAAQGIQDLNGDGDFMDNVAHVLDVP